MRRAPRPGSPVLADAPAVRTPLGIPRPPGARGGPGDAGGDVHGEAEAGDEYAGLLHVALEAGEQPPVRGGHRSAPRRVRTCPLDHPDAGCPRTDPSLPEST